MINFILFVQWHVPSGCAIKNVRMKQKMHRRKEQLHGHPQSTLPQPGAEVAGKPGAGFSKLKRRVIVRIITPFNVVDNDAEDDISFDFPSLFFIFTDNFMRYYSSWDRRYASSSIYQPHQRWQQ
jgi:hypothetical protein